MDQELKDFIENRLNTQSNQLDDYKFMNIYDSLLSSVSKENKKLLEILYDNFNDIIYEEKIKAYKLGFTEGIYITISNSN